jgi:hypothetical protein
MDRDRHRPRAFPGGIADAGRDTAAKQEKYLEQSPVHMRADMPVIQPAARLDQLVVSKFGAPGLRRLAIQRELGNIADGAGPFAGRDRRRHVKCASNFGCKNSTSHVQIDPFFLHLPGATMIASNTHRRQPCVPKSRLSAPARQACCFPTCFNCKVSSRSSWRVVPGKTSSRPFAPACVTSVALRS